MLEEALSAGIMRFDTCARGVAAPTPSVLLAALAAAGEEQAVDEGAERAQEAVSSAQSLAGSLSFSLSGSCLACTVHSDPAVRGRSWGSCKGCCDRQRKLNGCLLKLATAAQQRRDVGVALMSGDLERGLAG